MNNCLSYIIPGASNSLLFYNSHMFLDILEENFYSNVIYFLFLVLTLGFQLITVSFWQKEYICELIIIKKENMYSHKPDWLLNNIELCTFHPLICFIFLFGYKQRVSILEIWPSLLISSNVLIPKALPDCLTRIMMQLIPQINLKYTNSGNWIE